MSHQPIRQAPANLAPVTVAIIREALATRAGEGAPVDALAVAARVRSTCVGWTRGDKLRLAANFAVIAAGLLGHVDEAQREQFLASLEED